MNDNFIDELLNHGDADIYDIQTNSSGPEGKLPLTEEKLRDSPSGDIFGWSLNVGMGWKASEVDRKEFLILSTMGGMRDDDGSPIALGYHTGHWEISSLVREAAKEIKNLGAIPFTGYCSDPCDGRMQGNSGMMDSLPYRNDASIVLKRLIRCLPTRSGVIGIATCDKGLPAMMMALASMRDLPSIVVLGGVTLPPTSGEDAGKIQSLPARFAQGEITLEYAQEVSCRTCASPGGGCQFLGTAATSQVVSEALGISLVHSALSPSGQKIWLENAANSSKAILNMENKGITISDILTDKSVENAMVVHAAFGGSTNLLIHLPAVAHAAGLRRPSIEDWTRINKKVPRLVDVLPNGPIGHPTVQVFLAGGVPEVMLELRELDLLHLDVMTVSGEKLGAVLDKWEKSERRIKLKEQLIKKDKINPEDVIMSKSKASEKGLTSTVTFPVGNISPEGSVIKSTAIDPALLDENGVYKKVGPAKVFYSKRDAITAIKSGIIKPGDIMLVICAGPMGSGMEETYEVTAALKHVSWGKHVALLTDARFSGVSTGACIGHIGPEALAGGPIGKVINGDKIEIVVDCKNLNGSVNLLGESGDGKGQLNIENGNSILDSRPPNKSLAANEGIPDDTRLWAALQDISGGTWGGCVYDTDKIIEILEAGKKALSHKEKLTER